MNSWGHPRATPYPPRSLAAGEFTGGDFGFEANNNPVVPMNDRGQVVVRPDAAKFKAPRYEHIDSSRRDTEQYPNPTSFRLHFDKPLRGVESIELTDIIVPSVSASANEPPGNYFLVANGLVTENTSGDLSFTPQGNNFGIYNSMNGKNCDGNGLNNGKDMSNYSIIKLKYDPSRQVQCWERDGFYHIKYYNPLVSSIEYLDFSLIDRDGFLYDMDYQEDWSCTLQIMCKN